MRKLTKKQLPLYALAGLGPNLLMTIVSTYLIDALSVEGFGQNVANWTFYNKTIVVMAVFSVLVTVAKVIDGIIDVPMAALTDNLRTRWGKRRPAILIGYIPLVLSYLAMCFPLTTEENSVLNTAWIFIVLVILYCSYTLTLVTFYGTFSEVTESFEDRAKLSYYKTFFDTVQYAVGYAVIPLLIGATNIRWIALGASPLLLTMIIPFFLLKEKSTRKQDVEQTESDTNDVKEQNVGMLESIKITFKNKDFIIWILVFGVFFFGAQIFLTGQNVIASGAMGLNSWRIAVMNTMTFAPVPLMSVLYNKLLRKKGFKVAFQVSIASFALAMASFAVAYVEWIASMNVRFVIGCIGSFIGSFGIGTFFSVMYLIPSQIAADEVKRTGKSHPSMYFATQGLCTAIFGALATGVVWINLKTVSTEDQPYLGTHVALYVVIGVCVLAIGLAFLLPKYLSNFGKTDKRHYMSAVTLEERKKFENLVLFGSFLGLPESYRKNKEPMFLAIMLIIFTGTVGNLILAIIGLVKYAKIKKMSDEEFLAEFVEIDDSKINEDNIEVENHSEVSDEQAC